MMATGGLVLVIPNGGNAEYIKNGVNCLIFSHGEIDKAVAAIDELVSKPALRAKLIKNGREIAESYAWDQREAGILSLYE
jgi:glycosyltransferase involved in cell wall biosynthesis